MTELVNFTRFGCKKLHINESETSNVEYNIIILQENRLTWE